MMFHFICLSFGFLFVFVVLVGLFFEIFFNLVAERTHTTACKKRSGRGQIVGVTALLSSSAHD